MPHRRSVRRSAPPTSAQIVANIEQALLPLLRQLEQHTNVDIRNYTAALKKSLNELTSKFGERLATSRYGLSPREIQICHYIRQGLHTKDIASLLNISQSTVENQRNSIRRKLGLASSASNLIAHLRSL